MAISFNSFSQRYLTEIFTSVTVTPNVKYGNNISVLTGTPTPSDLFLDVYEPTGDTLAKRPLIIVLHTGSFLPAIINGQPTGSRKDSAVVEMCTKFAKRGYVAVAATYRLGWNPTSTNQDVRTGTLLNAVYRSIQDAKNCVRFFKNDQANTNTYKIDSTKIAVGGIGSGGYIALAYATLNKSAELQLTKFMDFSGTTPVPYVNQTVSGNFDGTDSTMLNKPNYKNHTSTINMVFNIGGALGDTTWLEAGEIPVASIHCYKDPFAPFKTGAVIVPTTGQFVVQASGSYDVQRLANQLGNNAILNNVPYNDPYSVKALNSANNGYKNLFPFITPAPGAALPCGAQTEQGSPWDWWDQPTFIAQYNAATSTTNGAGANCNQLRSNPDMTATKARKYVDSLQGFLSPRLACGLGLAQCALVGVQENINQVEVSIYPNPSANDFNINVTGTDKIQQIELFDVTGRTIKTISGLNTNSYLVNREGINAGVYFTKITLNNKNIVTKKIILE